MKAIVQKVIPEGKHGPFVVATSEELEGSVTFSLEPTVWRENGWPEPGMLVFLGELRKKRAGWRAKLARFWKPSDEQTQQSERSNQMFEFLYPTSRQFPFDEICEAIVRELEKRNWDVPGITVEFDEYGTGEQKFRLARTIKGTLTKGYEQPQYFKIHFCRVQRTMPGGRWNDIAAATEIVIPREELNIYEDESGPTFYLYVGDNWERDHERFINGSKVNSKLNGEPKMYLRYEGACDCLASEIRHTHSGRRSPVLAHTNDLGREYDPEGNQPQFYWTAPVMEKFRRYLEEHVLAHILVQPIPPEKIDRFAPPAPIPFPTGMPLFTFGEYQEVERIIQGKKDPSKLKPDERYASIGIGYRLVPWDVPNDGTVPEIAYEGFLWCGVGEVTESSEIESLEVPGHYRWSDSEKYVIRVNPNRANDIYIADHAQYDKRRKELNKIIDRGWLVRLLYDICCRLRVKKMAESFKSRTRFTDAEVNDFVRARGRTIIPLSEYHGGYKQPVVLINRELSFDEVEVVRGPSSRN